MCCKLAIKTFILLLLAIEISIQLLSQTTSLSFTSIPLTNADLNAPGRGVEQWHDQNIVNVPTEGVNTQRLDVYYRFVWTKIEGPTLGSYTWTFFDSLVNMAIQKKQKFSFGIMTVYPGGTLQNGLVSYDGGNSSYPLYLHTLMQSEAVKDWRTGSTWTPNYNSTNYQNRLLALNQAIDAHIKSTSYNGVPYRNVISCIDIRGYGAWGEWHSGYTPNNVISDYPAGTFPTVASLKKIVDAHTQGFPDFPLVAMIAAFDAQWLQNTWNPPEIAYYVLTQRNNWGFIGWRRDQWGATDSYLSSYLENNTRSFNGLVFRDSIMVRWKSSPITGEPPAWNPNNYADLERQIRLYHATSFGNGNYGVTPTTTIKDRVRASSKACGYRLILESGSLTLNGNNLSISLNWKNTGLAPTYENWDVVFELKNGSNVTVWSGKSQFKPKGFQPLTSATPITDNFSAVPAGTFNLYISVKDSNGYRDPLPLAITGRNTDGSYTLTTQLTVQSSTPAPTVSVTDNCGSSVLTASGYTGTLLWSTGETAPSITVNNTGVYSVTQTVNGSTSGPGSATAAPKAIPVAPLVTVADNCGNSLLTASGYTGTLLWSTGASTSSITVNTAGLYSVSQTVNGCTSINGIGNADPKSVPVAPSVAVVNNCGSSMLTASGYSGSLLWNNGATTPSITVSDAGTYTVSQTVNGCTSPQSTSVAAPIVIPSAPSLSVVNNCASSVLTASGYSGALLWNTGETTPSITITINETYSVTQTVNGCTSTGASIAAAPKTIPAAPTINVTNNCGSSLLTASGYTGSLMWSTGATTSSITVTTEGTYSVTQTVNGCTSSDGNGIAAPLNANVPMPAIDVVNNCGSSILTASGYTGSLMWSNGAVTPSISVTSAGTYTVTQTVNGCVSSAANGAAEPKTIPSAPVVTVTDNCENSLLTASDATGALLWSNGATTSSISVLSAGTYTVTQTVNGCISNAGSGTAAPKAKPSNPSVTVINNCGNSVLTASGYTGSLMWSNGATTSSITVFTQGTYNVTQTVNGCVSDAGIGIADPIDNNVPAPAIAIVNNCGNSVLTASGYTGSLLWSTGATSSSITVMNGGNYSVSQSIDGCISPATNATAAPVAIPDAPMITVDDRCESSVLTASGYTGSLLWSNDATTSSVTVTTGGIFTVSQTINGCTSAQGTATASPKPIPTAPVISVTDNCSNSLLSASGYTGALLWSNGSTASFITITEAGEYSVTQTVNGCTSDASNGLATPVRSTIAIPSVTVSNNCGSSMLTASGYTGSLLWSTGSSTSSIVVTTADTYTVTQTINGCASNPGSGVAAPLLVPSSPNVTVVNNCENSMLTATGFTGSLLWNNDATTSLITVTEAGPYTVTQTVNGCTSPEGSGIASPKLVPSAPGVTVVDNCGSSVLTATGFTGSLAWSNGASTPSITVSSAGTYTVTQTVNGCTSEAGSGEATPINSNVLAPTVTVVNNCGNSVLTASDYTGPLLWSNGATTSSITVTNGGTYTVSQTINGCSSPAGIGIANPVAVPAAPIVSVTNNCESSLLTASGFTGSLLWNNDATTSAITVINSGTYTVTQTVNGCISETGGGTASPKPIPPAPSVTVVNNCGNSILTASGFTGLLLWSNGATTSSITVTTGGNYTVTQTVNGCVSAAAQGLASPLSSSIVAPTVNVGDNCGSSTLTASGYTGSLLWSNGATTPSINVTTAGNYTVTQTVNGCTSTPGSGTASPKLVPSAPVVSVIDNCGSSILTASGFTGSLLWSNGATTSAITVTTAATYTVTQTVNSCQSAAGSGVSAPIAIPVAPDIAVADNCGSSILTASNFTGSLLWSNGATTSSITVTTGGAYGIIQTINGCTSSTRNATASPKAIPAAPTVAVVNDCGNSVLTASNFTGSLLWSNGATTSSITVTTGGTYGVTQTINGCTSSTRSVTASPKAIPSAPTVTVVDNCGNSVLTASNFTGSLLWSNGATTSSITVSTAGTYTVSQTVSGCTSALGSGTAAPTGTSVAAPVVTVVNNCGNSVLTASNFAGSLLWSTGATTSSITVTTAATYTVTQTVNGCTSAAASGVAAPKTTPATPTVAVTNNCANSVLTASNFTGSLLWSNGATTSSIAVTTAGTYTVTQTVNGCTSIAGSGVAAPKTTPAAPNVAVTNNCANSVLTASNFTGSLLWSNGATTSSITVTTAATYTVTQTVNGCTSAAGSGTAAPKTTPVAPTVTVVNNCGSSVLTASNFTGSLLWSNGATTSSITVTTAATYTVTQTVNGCTSTTGSGIAAPKSSPTLSSSLTATAFNNTVFTYSPTSATSGTTFTWSRAAVTGVSNAAANGTGNISETLVNTSTTAKTITYVYTLTANGCTNTQNVVVTLNPPATTNCVINASITSSFNSTSIPAGRYIWFNSVFSRGSLSGISGTVTIIVTNSKISFTANSVQYTLNVPSSRIRYDAAVSSATTRFVNNIWETAVPRNYTGDVFMGGLAYQVPTSLPGGITNITWTANISIDKVGVSLSWEWAAAVYTSFAAHSGLNIKPKDGNSQNPYPNNDNAGTPENFKSFLVSGAKGSGGSNYTGSYSSTSTATCTVNTGQRPSAQPVITQQSFAKQLPALTIEQLLSRGLEVSAIPNPSNSSFNLLIKGRPGGKVKVRVIDISGRVVEVHENVPSNNILRIGERLASGSYFVEVIQNNEQKKIKVLKFD